MTLSHSEAGLRANSLPQSDPESASGTWRNLTSSWGSTRALRKTTRIMVSDFISPDATETSFILLFSWRQAQQSPTIWSRIRAVVVVESVIAIWDRYDSIQLGNFMNIDRGGMSLTLLWSWPPGPTTSRNRIHNRPCGRGGIWHQGLVPLGHLLGDSLQGSAMSWVLMR